MEVFFDSSRLMCRARVVAFCGVPINRRPKHRGHARTSHCYVFADIEFKRPSFVEMVHMVDGRSLACALQFRKIILLFVAGPGKMNGMSHGVVCARVVHCIVSDLVVLLHFLNMMSTILRGLNLARQCTLQNNSVCKGLSMLHVLNMLSTILRGLNIARQCTLQNNSVGKGQSSRSNFWDHANA